MLKNKELTTYDVWPVIPQLGGDTEVQRCGAGTTECQDLWEGGTCLRVLAFSHCVPVFAVKVLTNL